MFICSAQKAFLLQNCSSDCADGAYLQKKEGKIRRVRKVLIGVLGTFLGIGAVALVFSIVWNLGDGEDGTKVTRGLGTIPNTATEDPLGCSKMRDRWGRPLVVRKNRLLGEYFCDRLPQPDPEAERGPMWVLRGKKVWADDWTPCPFPIEAARCDEIRERDLHGRRFCAYGPQGPTMRHYVEIVEDSPNGDFVIRGYGDGPALVGFELGTAVAEESLSIRGKVAERGEGVFINDVRHQDFVVVKCTPQGDITFEVLDERGKPLERQWRVSPVRYRNAGQCEIKEYGHKLCRVFADRDIEVVFDIAGMPPQYRKVRAKKGEVTHEVVVIDIKGIEETTGSVEGYVWDAETGEPMAGARIVISTRSPSADILRFSAYTDEKGFYKFIGIKPEWFFDVFPILGLRNNSLAIQRVSYNMKSLGVRKVLRLDFPMPRGRPTTQVQWDPEVEFLDQDYGCVSQQALDDVIPGASKYLENRFNLGFDALANCLGWQHRVVEKLRNYYHGGGTSTKQKICVRPTLQEGTIDPFMGINKPLDHGWDGVIYVSGKYLAHLIDPDAPRVEHSSWFLHELMHVASPYNPANPWEQMQGEVDAYACQFVCTVERELLPYDGLHKYPCALPSLDLEECLSGAGWEQLFELGLIYGLEGCPTPSAPLKEYPDDARACQPPSPDTFEPPACEPCCPIDQSDPDCNPDMKCWMEFAPDSPQGLMETERFKQAVCLSVYPQGGDCSNFTPPSCVKPVCHVARVPEIVNVNGAPTLVYQCVDMLDWVLDHMACEDGDPFTVDRCDPLYGCIHRSIDGDSGSGNGHPPASDGDSGSGNGHPPVSCIIQSGTQTPGSSTIRSLLRDPTLCNDGDECTTDICTPEGICLYLYVGCQSSRPPHLEPPGNPGSDNPDESLSPPNMQTELEGSEGLLHALVLRSGLYSHLASVLEKAGITAHIVDVDFLPEEVLEIARVLIVPSGGLADVYGLESFTTRITRFAELGGVVVVLSQPKGYMYEAVSNDITAYGWWESQSCFFGGVDVATRHPVVSSANQKTISLPVDGAFVEDQESVVLLRKGSGGFPVMVMKAKGDGRILMTGMYPDYAYFNGQSSAEALNILRDIVAWGEAPDHVPVYDPDKPITLEFEKEMHWKVMSPDGKELVAEGFGKEASLVIGKGKGGVYHVLIEEDNQWKPCAQCRFAVMGYVFEEMKEPFTLSITTPTEHYFYGDNATFTVLVTSLSPEEMEVDCNWWVWQGGWIKPDEGGEVRLSLEPQEKRSFGVSVKVREFGWLYVKCENQDGYTVMTRKSFLAITPEVSLRIETDKTTYEPQETIEFTISVDGGDAFYSIVTEIFGAKGELLDQRYDIISGSGTIVHQFVAPVWSHPGQVTIHSEVYLSDRLVGFATKPVRVAALFPQLDLSFGPENIIAKIKVHNPGPIPIPQGTLSLTITKEDGTTVASASQEVSEIGVGKSVELQAGEGEPFAFGRYVVIGSLDAKGLKWKARLFAKESAKVLLHAPSSLIATQGNVIFFAGIRNDGDLNLHGYVSCELQDVSSPAQPHEVHLQPSEMTTVFCEIPLPEEVETGTKKARVRLTLDSYDFLVREFPVHLPAAVPEVTLLNEELGAGENIHLRLANRGLGELHYQLNVGLSCSDAEIQLLNTEGVVLVVEPTDFTVPVPESLSSGLCFVRAEVRDKVTGAITPFVFRVTIRGQEAKLTVSLDNIIFPPTAPIEARVEVQNVGATDIHGIVDAQVVGAGGPRLVRTLEVPRWGASSQAVIGIALAPDGTRFALIGTGSKEVKYDRIFLRAYGPDGSLKAESRVLEVDDWRLGPPKIAWSNGEVFLLVHNQGQGAVYKFNSELELVAQSEPNPGDQSFWGLGNLLPLDDIVLVLEPSPPSRIALFDRDLRWLRDAPSPVGTGFLVRNHGVALVRHIWKNNAYFGNVLSPVSPRGFVGAISEGGSAWSWVVDELGQPIARTNLTELVFPSEPDTYTFHPMGAAKASPDGYYLVGACRPSSSLFGYFCVAKISSRGEPIWLWRQTGFADHFAVISSTPDGGCVAAGSAYGGAGLMFVRLGKNGYLYHSKIISSLASLRPRAIASLQQGYAVAGELRSVPSGAVVAVLDSFSNVQWIWNSPTGWPASWRFLAIAPDGEQVIVAGKGGSDANRFYVAKVAQQGPTWEWVGEVGEARAITPVGDNQILVAGEMNYTGSLVALTRNGDFLWSKTLEINPTAMAPSGDGVVLRDNERFMRLLSDGNPYIIDGFEVFSGSSRFRFDNDLNFLSEGPLPKPSCADYDALMGGASKGNEILLAWKCHPFVLAHETVSQVSFVRFEDCWVDYWYRLGVLTDGLSFYALVSSHNSGENSVLAKLDHNLQIESIQPVPLVRGGNIGGSVRACKEEFIESSGPCLLHEDFKKGICFSDYTACSKGNVRSFACDRQGQPLLVYEDRVVYFRRAGEIIKIVSLPPDLHNIPVAKFEVANDSSVWMLTQRQGFPFIGDLWHLDSSGQVLGLLSNAPSHAFFLMNGENPAFALSDTIIVLHHENFDTVRTIPIPRLHLEDIVSGPEGGFFGVSADTLHWLDKGGNVIDEIRVPLEAYSVAYSNGTIAVVTSDAVLSVRPWAEPYWEATVPVDIPKGLSEWVQMVVPAGLPEGGYNFVANIENENGQVIAEDIKTFEVSSEGVTVFLELLEQTVLESTEVLAFRGVVTNATDSFVRGKLYWKLDDGLERLISELDIAAGSSVGFESGIPGPFSLGRHLVTVSFLSQDKSYRTAREFYAVRPSVVVIWEAPDVIGTTKFDVRAQIWSKDFPVTLDVSLNGAGMTAKESFVLAKGKKGMIELKGVEIFEDTEFRLEVSGDVSLVQTKLVRFGSSVELVPLVQNFLQTGVAELPFLIRNTGEVSDVFKVQVGLWKNGYQIHRTSRSYLLGVGEEVIDAIQVTLASGEYELRLSSLDQEISQKFTVMPQDLVFAEVKVERGQSGFSYAGHITNYGIFDFYGFFEIATSAFLRVEEGVVPAMSTVQISGTFPALGHRPGANELALFVREEHGDLVASAVAPFEVRAATVRASAPSSLAFKSGGLISAWVRLEAEGDLDALVRVEGKTGECSSTEIVRLKPHEWKTSTLLCEVPEDSPSFEDYAVFRLFGLNDTEAFPPLVVVPYSIIGKEVEIIATLDRKTYSVFDSAVVTLSVRSKKGSFPILLKLTHADYSWETNVTASHEWQSFDVRFTVLDFDSKVGYSVLDPTTKKSLAIGFLNINEAFNDVSIWTDKDSYVAGERILITARASSQGELEFAIPDWGIMKKVELPSESPVNFDTLVPKDAVSGVYKLHYRLGTGEPHVYSVSIEGLRVVIKALELDRFQYEESEQGELIAVVHSNETIPASIEIVRNVEGIYETVSLQDFTIVRGVSTFVAPFYVGDRIGNGEVMVLVREGSRLVALGKQRFQVGNIWLSLSLTVPEYGSSMPVMAHFGTHLKENGILRLDVNHKQVFEDKLGPGWSYGKVQIEPATLFEGLNEVVVSVESHGQSLERRKSFQWKSTTEHMEQAGDVLYENLDQVGTIELQEHAEPNSSDTVLPITENAPEGVAVDQGETFDTKTPEYELTLTDIGNDKEVTAADTVQKDYSATTEKTKGRGGCNTSPTPSNRFAFMLVMCVAVLRLAVGLVKRKKR